MRVGYHWNGTPHATPAVDNFLRQLVHRYWVVTVQACNGPIGRADASTVNGMTGIAAIFYKSMR